MSNSTRFSLLLSIAFSLLIPSGVFAAGQPLKAPPSLSKEVAIRLLALRDERFAKDYEVALIMPGETEFQGLTVAQAAAVTFFGPDIVKGKKKRRLQTEMLLWNEEYGWFFCEFGERLGRTTVFIWSELLGEVEID